ncbi:MAG: hypothetical protein IID41_10890 [Planctomycetes bacterium]|nr:hypothetical protein [Planctomycetota bacterium]
MTRPAKQAITPNVHRRFLLAAILAAASAGESCADRRSRIGLARGVALRSTTAFANSLSGSLGSFAAVILLLSVVCAPFRHINDTAA